eukprot:Lithocolla_globosa_v1_NODE_325_length_4469_cov_325.839148.p3 type:complete len:130 gc:universal NODE_325_length_4469_cov_325.839148:2587-2976(+)
MIITIRSSLPTKPGIGRLRVHEGSKHTVVSWGLNVLPDLRREPRAASPGTSLPWRSRAATRRSMMEARSVCVRQVPPRTTTGDSKPGLSRRNKGHFWQVTNRPGRKKIDSSSCDTKYPGFLPPPTNLGL